MAMTTANQKPSKLPPPQTPQLIGMEVFSSTKHQERQTLGEWITRWLEANPEVKIMDKIVTQSSDSQFHCLTITIIYAGKATVTARSIKS